MNDLRSTALQLAAKRLRVFPCAVGGKVPATRNGVKDATCDPDQIRKWWNGNPDYNIGLACGAASNVFALDVDGDNGEHELAKLEAEHGKLPATIISTTGKGRHFLFAYPEKRTIRNSASQLAPNLDIRGDGGYVVVPPSLHPSGRRYAWAEDCANNFAPGPDWLLAKISAGKAKAVSATPAADWHELACGVTEGQRNVSIARMAGLLLRRGIDPHMTYELMQSWNATHCQPALDADEVETIVNSICECELRRRGLSNG